MTAPPRDSSTVRVCPVRDIVCSTPNECDQRETGCMMLINLPPELDHLRAATAPSADQDQNGGQGHEAYVHCSLGALPLESGNAREATCLNTEPSARTGTDTQQGQLGANAGSISAPPTSTPAAQLAEPVLPCAIDGCKQPSLMPASEYCSLHSAIGTSPTGGEFATQPAEPPATDDPARGLTFAGAIDYWRNIAEKAMAERDAMRECVLAADVMRAGYSVMWGERPTSTLDAYDAARAKVKP